MQFQVEFTQRVTAVVWATNRAEVVRALRTSDSTLDMDTRKSVLVGIPKVESMAKAKADTLIKNKAHRGDHGFTGEALVVWRKQRGDILVALRTLKAGRSVTTEMWNAIQSNRCPQTVAGGESNGTEAGYLWVDDAVSFIDNSR